MATVSFDKLQNPTGISREDVLKFPFPYKLWIAISLPTAKFLNWNSDGTVIQVNLKHLQEYLHSSYSIFIIKTSAKFLKHLEDFQFNRLEESDASGGAVIDLFYQHKYFQRYRLDLVPKIRRVTFFNLDNAQNAELEASITPSTSLCAARMRGDLCFMEHGFLTEMQKKRIQSEIVFSFTRESRVLQEKLKKAEEKINVGSSGKRGRSACLEREQIVVLPKDLYENPYDSVLAGKGGFQGHRYGGYYGNCTVEQIDSFFGAYLPKYSEGGVLKVKNFKDNAENNGQTGKLPGDTAPSDSGLPNDENTTAQNCVAIEEFMEVDNFITNNSNETSNLTDASNINISASFNCNNGAVEFNITEYSNDVILIPPYENLNVIPVNPLNEINSPIAEAVETIVPNRQQDENTDFYDDLRATFELLQNQSF